MILRPEVLVGYLFLANVRETLGFAATVFQPTPTLQHKVPSRSDGVDIELPNFDELFSRMKVVSPLLRNVVDRKSGGLAAIDDSTNLNWKRVESHKSGSVLSIDKIENYEGHPCPLVRFRSTIKGPCIGSVMANFIMNVDERKKWDDQIDEVYEIYPINDLDAANIAMDFGKYGDCSRLGVGYCRTKANFGIDSREQLTLCGCQDFDDGSCIVWGVEMEDWHNYMLPPCERHTRAKSHVFCTTMQPTSEGSFDVEYLLQLEVGGNLPQWLTTPVMVNSIKNMFRHATNVYGGEQMKDYITKQEAKEAGVLDSKQSLLMTF